MALDALLYGVIAGAATLAGISAVWWKWDSAIEYSHYVNSFAAGALITIALAHLIPESVELTSNALLIVLASFNCLLSSGNSPCFPLRLRYSLL